MFFELSKFVNFFLISPISWIFLLLISFCLCKKNIGKGYSWSAVSPYL